MIIDTSVLVALVKLEDEAPAFVAAMTDGSPIRMSAANYFEFAMMVDKLKNPAFSARVDQIIERFRIVIEPVTREIAVGARRAYRTYGKGNHEARLNFGDCFAYALAQEMGEPLLFKGADFARTDVEPALPSRERD